MKGKRETVWAQALVRITGPYRIFHLAFLENKSSGSPNFGFLLASNWFLKCLKISTLAPSTDSIQLQCCLKRHSYSTNCDRTGRSHLHNMSSFQIKHLRSSDVVMFLSITSSSSSPNVSSIRSHALISFFFSSIFESKEPKKWFAPFFDVCLE